MARHRRGVLRGLATLTAGAAIVGSTSARTGDDSCGCSDATSDGEWTHAGGNTPGSWQYDGTVSIDPESLAVAWRYRPEDGNLRYRHAAVADGTVFLNVEGNVHALDADSGDLVWKMTDIGYEDRTRVSTSEKIGPVVDAGTVYVGGDQLTALDATDGSVLWQVDRKTRAIIATDGLVYAYQADDDHEDVGMNVTVYDAEGDEQWSALPVDASDNDERDAYTSPRGMSVSGGSLYVAVSSDFYGYEQGLIAFDAQTGETELIEQWLDGGEYFRGLISSDETVVYRKRFNGAHVNPPYWGAYDAAEAEHLSSFHGTTDDDAARFQAFDGQHVYSRVTDPYYDPTTDEEEIVLNVRDVETNETAWDYEIPVGSVIVTNDAAFVTSGERLVALNPDDGEELWTYTDEDGGFFDGGQLVAVDGETIYVLADGGLLALRSSNADDSEEGDDENDDGDTGDDNSADGDGDDTSNETGDDEDANDENDDGTGDENEDGDEDENGTDSDDSAPEDGAGDSEGSPGFGVVTGVAGVVGGAAVAAQRRLRTDED